MTELSGCLPLPPSPLLLFFSPSSLPLHSSHSLSFALSSHFRFPSGFFFFLLPSFFLIHMFSFFFFFFSFYSTSVPLTHFHLSLPVLSRFPSFFLPFLLLPLFSFYSLLYCFILPHFSSLFLSLFLHLHLLTHLSFVTTPSPSLYFFPLPFNLLHSSSSISLSPPSFSFSLLLVLTHFPALTVSYLSLLPFTPFHSFSLSLHPSSPSFYPLALTSSSSSSSLPLLHPCLVSLVVRFSLQAHITYVL